MNSNVASVYKHLHIDKADPKKMADETSPFQPTKTNMTDMKLSLNVTVQFWWCLAFCL